MVRSRRSLGLPDAGSCATLRFAQRDWHVFGVFDAGHTGFGSEIRSDAEQMMQAFRRGAIRPSCCISLTRPPSRS